MCEEAPAVIYCVGYILPIGCCVAGACMSCYGCYRWYNAQAQHMRRQQRGELQTRHVVREQPKLKRDTLKSRLTERFLGLVGSKEIPASMDVELKKIAMKDLKESCPICLMDYENDSSQIFIGLIKGCGHYFHFECIWEWLERKQTCPICREACDLAETDIWGLSLKQVIDFMEPTELVVDKKPSLSSHGNCSHVGNNVVHIHIHEGSSSDVEHSQGKSDEVVGTKGVGIDNEAFQADTSGIDHSSAEDNLNELETTSPDMSRS